jgi:hypothetical protein
MITQQQLEQSKAVFEHIYGITPEDHHMMIYEAGIKRIELITRSSESQRKKLESSPQWWKWWALDWNQKNMEMLLQLGFDAYQKPEEVRPFEREAVRECFVFVHAGPPQIFTYPSKVMVR